MKKDTIYIDIEDDITSIIDKVKQSPAKIAALVPPKRSTALNSAVNMKLLGRAAEEAKKHLVLVTSETTLLSLAGGLGLHVAKNLHSKPYVPKVTTSPVDDDVVIDGDELDATASIGELAGLDDEVEAKPPAKKVTKTEDAKTGFGFKIPNFERFRGRLFLIGAALLLLVVGWWWAFWIAPRATIAIEAQTSRVDTVFEFTADTAAEADDFDKNIFKAETAKISRTITESFTPTGTKNVGEKASGTITVRNCDYPEGFTLPGGTRFEANGLQFESLEAIAVGSFSGPASFCDLEGNESGKGTGNIRAISAGDQFNLAPTGFAITSNNPGGNVDAVGSQMSGGTTKEVKVVAQKDVDTARQKLESADHGEVLGELKTQFGEETVSIDETYDVVLSDIKSQPAVGEEATSANITATANFTVMGIARETLTKAVEDFQRAKIEGGNQSIYTNGMDQLVFTVLSQSKAKAEIRLRTEGFIGPELDTQQLAQDVTGQRYSEVIETVKSRPGVIDVRVDFSPFWVFSAPAADKIDISFDIRDSTSPPVDE